MTPNQIRRQIRRRACRLRAVFLRQLLDCTGFRKGRDRSASESSSKFNQTFHFQAKVTG